MSKNSKLIRIITGNAILVALTVILSLFPLRLADFKINLGIVPIVIGACLYGPLSGLGLGLVNGALNLLDAASFLAVNPFMTVVLCFAKTGIAGLVAGLVYKLFKNNNKSEKKSIELIGTFVAALLVPILNTGIFVVGSWLFFSSVMGTDFLAIVTALFTTNFLIEFLGTLFLAPAIYQIIKIVEKTILNK